MICRQVKQERRVEERKECRNQVTAKLVRRRCYLHQLVYFKRARTISLPSVEELCEMFEQAGTTSRLKTSISLSISKVRVQYFSQVRIFVPSDKATFHPCQLESPVLRHVKLPNRVWNSVSQVSSNKAACNKQLSRRSTLIFSSLLPNLQTRDIYYITVFYYFFISTLVSTAAFTTIYIDLFLQYFFS